MNKINRKGWSVLGQIGAQFSKQNNDSKHVSLIVALMITLLGTLKISIPSLITYHLN